MPLSLRAFFYWVKKAKHSLSAFIQEFIEGIPEFFDSFAEGYKRPELMDPKTRHERLLKGFITRDKILFGKDSVFRVHGLWSLGEFYRESYRYGDAERYFREACNLLWREAENETEGKLPVYYREKTSGLADFLCLYGKLAEARGLLETVIEKAPGKDHRERADDYFKLGELQSKLGDHKAAATSMLAARDCYEQVFGPDSMALVEILEKMAMVLPQESAEPKALAAIKEQLNLLMSVAINDKALGQDHSSNRQALEDLSAFYRRCGKLEFAEKLYVRAEIVRLAQKVKGVPYPSLVRDLRELARLYRKRGDGADATMAFHAERKAKIITGEIR